MIDRDPEAPNSAREVVEQTGFADELRSGPLPALTGYEILRRLDSGGQGSVYSAYQTSTGRRVAIKILREFGGDTRLKEERLRREARFLSRLHHPNIVTIHDIGSANNQVYLVTDFIDGVPIDDHVNLNAASVRDIVELLVKVCDAMAVAHAAGVVHRDLKPQNIVVDENNQPYVLDFGLAQSLEEDLPRLSETDAVVGTVEYLPPERIKGHHPDTRSDVYALGLILYECIADQLPFSGDNRAAMLHAIVYDEPIPLRRAAAGEKLNPNTPPSHLSRDLESVVMKAIARNVHDRYQSAADMAADLRRLLDDEPVLARSTSTGYMLRRIVRRYRVHFTAACIVLLLLVGSLVAVTTAWREAEYAVLQTQVALQMAGAEYTGAVLRGSGQIDVAIENFNAAVRLGESVENPSDDVIHQQYNAHYRLAELYHGLGQTDEARRHTEAAIALAPQLIERRSGQTESASVQILRGNIEVSAERFDLASQAFLAAADEYERIAAAPPDDYPYGVQVAHARTRAGESLEKIDRNDEALVQYQIAVATWMKLLDQSPNHPDFTLRLAVVESKLSNWHLRRRTEQDTRLALQLVEQAIARVKGVDIEPIRRDAERVLDALESNRAKVLASLAEFRAPHS